MNFSVHDTDGRPSARKNLLRQAKLAKEDDEGCVEYKWRLTGVTPQRLEHLITQMKFRVEEGHGECVYELGVSDNGVPKGLTADDFAESLGTIERMARRLNFETSIVMEKLVGGAPVRKCAEILVRRYASTERIHDLRVVLLGDHDVGKSTLVGVLTQGTLDDGFGSGRQSAFNHKHELQSGKTSSISERSFRVEWEDDSTEEKERKDLASFAAKHVAHGLQAETQNGQENVPRLVTLVDVAGDPKYSKTTLYGVTCQLPHMICVVASVERPASDLARHIELCRSIFDAPYFIVLTKCDLLQMDVELHAYLDDVSSILSAHHQDVCVVDDASLPSVIDGAICISPAQSHVPVLPISLVNGEGLPVLRRFLQTVPVKKQRTVGPAEVLVTAAFTHENSSPVLCGTVYQGCVTPGSTMLLGPGKDGSFSAVRVESIQIEGEVVRGVPAGMTASFAIAFTTPDAAKSTESAVDLTRKGLVLVHPDVYRPPVWEFTCEMSVIGSKSSNGVREGQEPIVHCRNVRQAAKVLAIDEHSALKRGCHGVVRLRFLFNPEVVSTGDRIVLRTSQHIRACGEVVAVHATVATSPVTSSVHHTAAGTPTKDDAAEVAGIEQDLAAPSANASWNKIDAAAEHQSPLLAGEAQT